MLNSGKENGLDFYAKEYSTATFFKGGIKGFENVAEDYIRSFKKSNLTSQEIENKYGLNAQNQALIDVRKNKNMHLKNQLKLMLNN